MNRKRISYGITILTLVVFVQYVSAGSNVGFREYTAVEDDLSGTVKTYGMLIVHQRYGVQLREVVPNVPILSLQYAGQHYREELPDDPKHVEARAKCVAEHIRHAWTLMDHGAKLEVSSDSWNVYRVHSRPTPPPCAAVYVRSPIAGSEPLRIMTIYPQDVAGYPWIKTEESLAEYLVDLIQAHYLLFWRNEGDINRYEELRIDQTSEGKIFKEIVVRALEVAKLKGQSRFDSETLEDALARVPLSQRERLYRMATTPPIDWESLSR
jgi:hypothetical protein